MKVKHLIIILLLGLTVSLLNGCAKMGAKLTGDDQLAKFQAGSNKLKGDDQMVKAEQNIKTDEISAIKKAMADLKGQMSANMGLINKTVSDMRDTSSGRDSIMNDPKMMIWLMAIAAVVVLFPILGLLFVVIVYIRVSQKNYGNLIAAINDDENMVMNVGKNKEDK